MPGGATVRRGPTGTGGNTADPFSPDGGEHFLFLSQGDGRENPYHCPPTFGTERSRPPWPRANSERPITPMRRRRLVVWPPANCPPGQSLPASPAAGTESLDPSPTLYQSATSSSRGPRRR